MGSDTNQQFGACKAKNGLWQAWYKAVDDRRVSAGTGPTEYEATAMAETRWNEFLRQQDVVRRFLSMPRPGRQRVNS